MRILFVAPGAQSGSHMPFVRREADALRALGHVVEVHGFDNRNYLLFFRELFRLRKIARKFDLVHAQFGKFSALAAALVGPATQLAGILKAIEEKGGGASAEAETPAPAEAQVTA